MRSPMITFVLLGAASAVVVPRQACMPLKHSVAPGPVPNTAEAFSDYPYFGDLAKVVVPPSGFEAMFINAAAAVRSPGYMNYVELETYDVSACAQQCDAFRGCEAFNIYFQRNPSVEPAAACPNPTANTLVVCGLYSAPINATEIVNEGQNRGPVDANGHAFAVVIRGSNVYSRVAKPRSLATTETVIVWSPAPCKETTTITTTAEFSNPFVPFLTPGPIAIPSTTRDSMALATNTPAFTSYNPEMHFSTWVTYTSTKTVYAPASTTMSSSKSLPTAVSIDRLTRRSAEPTAV